MEYVQKILPCLVGIILCSANRLQTCTHYFVVFLVGLRWKKLKVTPSPPRPTPPRCWAGVQCNCLLITAALLLPPPPSPPGWSPLLSSHNTALANSIVAPWQTALGWMLGSWDTHYTMICVQLG